MHEYINVAILSLLVEITDCGDLDITHDEKTTKKKEVKIINEAYEGSEVIKVELDAKISGS